MFFAGIRPAVNVGISVSRVGGAAQTKAMKKVAGTLRLDLSQYRELEAFAQFGSDLDQATQRRLNRGERIVEVLKQPQYSPMNVEDQVLIIYTATRGHLDDIPVDNIARFEKEFLAYIHANYPELGEEIRSEANLSEECEEKLVQVIREFKGIFNISTVNPLGENVIPEPEEGEEAIESEIGAEETGAGEAGEE